MRPAIPFLLFLLIPSLPALGSEGLPAAAADGTFPVRLSTWQPAQGEPLLVEAIPPPRADNVVMIWKGREIPMREEGRGKFLGLIGVDLQEPPGDALLTFRAVRGGEMFRVDAQIAVREGTFPVQELTLPKAMTQFDGETLKRINREARRLEERFSRVPSPPAWRFPFLPPVAEFRPKGFGSRRIINGEPRSPHAGVDVDLPAGRLSWRSRTGPWRSRGSSSSEGTRWCWTTGEACSASITICSMAMSPRGRKSPAGRGSAR